MSEQMNGVGGGVGSGTEPERPGAVPATAEYIEGWRLFSGAPERPVWGAGERNGTALTGRWRVWRPDGTLLEEGDWRDGERHGTLLRYHGDGTLAVRAEHRDGTPVTVTGHRCDNPSDDPFSFDGWAPVIRTIVHDFDERGTKVRWASYTADGTEATFEGVPSPERPPGVPEIATFWPDGRWSAPRWRDDQLNGVTRHWTTDGVLERIVHNRAGKEVASFPSGSAGAGPLIEAALDGDTASVELCLAAGLGASPGAARHAAHAGLPELALRLLRSAPPATVAPPEVRLPPEVPSTGVPEDAVWVAGLLAFVVGDLDTATGAALGTWRLWKQSWHSTSPTEGPSYHAPDSYYHGYEETDFAEGKPVENRTYLSGRQPYRVKRYRPDGGLSLERAYEYGAPAWEREWPVDGTTVHRRFHGDGALRVERVERNGTLETEHWYATDGTRTADVTAVDGTAGDGTAERWRALDPDGAVIAEGHVGPGVRGGPVGEWRLFDADGGDRGTVSFEGLDLARHQDLGRSAHAVRTWRDAPVSPLLAGVAEVAWDGLSTFYRSADEVPFLLKGLAVGDPEAFCLALSDLAVLLHHQHTITAATGPAFRFMTALAGPDGVRDEDELTELLRFLAAVATRDGDLASVHHLHEVHAALPADGTAPAEHYADHGVEPAYHEVHTALTGAVPTWTALAAHPNAAIRHRAVVLLAAAPGEAAARTLRERLTAEPEHGIRAEVLLGLSPHPADDDTRRAVERHLADDDPLIRFCAALTWVRQGWSPAGPGVRTLLEALRGDLDTEGFHVPYLAEDAPTDATTTLALLPPEEAGPLLPELCATLDRVDSVDAVAVANALLDIVFPTEAYQEGAPLTDAQRTVVRAIADSPGSWEFSVNLNEVLRRNGLPCDPEEIRTLARTAPAA
ncbi:hypothetical protein JNUCC64_03725 [Streptomyces sp. JNUCC 64]